MADVTFPVEPKVISLADYDRMSEAAESPKAGYPVVCVTACDPKNPLFEEVRALCEDERIDNTMTEYRLVNKSFRIKTSFLGGKSRRQPVLQAPRTQ